MKLHFFLGKTNFGPSTWLTLRSRTYWGTRASPSMPLPVDYITLAEFTKSILSRKHHRSPLRSHNTISKEETFLGFPHFSVGAFQVHIKSDLKMSLGLKIAGSNLWLVNPTCPSPSPCHYKHGWEPHSAEQKLMPPGDGERSWWGMCGSKLRKALGWSGHLQMCSKLAQLGCILSIKTGFRKIALRMKKILLGLYGAWLQNEIMFKCLPKFSCLVAIARQKVCVEKP